MRFIVTLKKTGAYSKVHNPPTHPPKKHYRNRYLHNAHSIDVKSCGKGQSVNEEEWSFVRLQSELGATMVPLFGSA